MGADYVETDPRPTQDGVIVNMHDPTVDRTTDGTGVVADMTFEEVRALGIRTLLPGDYSCERVPTLEEILRTCRDRAVVLVDANKTDRVDLLVDAILAADALEWAVFDTSSLEKIDAALAIEPNLEIMIRPASVDEIGPQLDHYAPRMPTIVELDLRTLALGVPMVQDRGGRVLVDVFGADALLNVAGDTSGYEEALNDGALILQTDRPEAVIQFLIQRGDR
jgi:glycerophosphoryl diester phosphodiesterase